MQSIEKGFFLWYDNARETTVLQGGEPLFYIEWG